MFEAIDSLVLAAGDVAAVSAAYGRLGLRPSPGEGAGPGGRRSFPVGDINNRVSVELLADDVRPPADPLREPIRRATAAGRGLFAVGLRVADLRAALDRLAARSVMSQPAGATAWLPLHEQAGADLVLAPAGPPPAAGAPDHAFPLKRLDHLATVAPDLDATCRFWEDVLGVPVAGEVRTPAMVIRQLRIGDAIFELLGPAAPDSPLHRRPPGLVSMAAWEVEDLAATVAQARAAGFTVPEPAVGVLPGTRTATIPAPELGGTAMQLLEYV
jgi:catechol 2,3-dioxygenase-like lactoylglutathione lyase family enzyme